MYDRSTKLWTRNERRRHGKKSLRPRRVRLVQKPGNRRLKTHRESAADKAWKSAVKSRDAHTCQRCGKYDLNIHAHHVAPRSRRPDLIHEISNGIGLCFACHEWVHNNPKESTTAGLLSDETYEAVRKAA